MAKGGKSMNEIYTYISEGFLDYGRNISGISRQELGPSFP
jgi:hypothetical protein